MASKLEVLALIRSDINAMVPDRGKGRIGYLASVLTKVLLYPRIQAAIAFRFAHFFYTHRLTLLGYYLQAWTLSHAGAEIHPAAEIGPGLCLIHSSGIVIGDKARVGSDFICFHGVTLGDSGKGDGMPTLGNRVTASAGAKILGGITIGDYAVIGANAVVLSDIPDDAVAVGIPARVARIRPKSQRALPADENVGRTPNA